MGDGALPPPLADPDAIEAVVREAGELAMLGWNQAGAGLVSWDKTPGNPVSESDLAVNTLLRTRLGALCPEAGWLSEESADNPERLDADWLWLTDPIDGTRDFVRGRPGWAISVALIWRGHPILGLLGAPARGEMWRAVTGQGAQLNGAKLSASRRMGFSGARVPADQLPSADSDLTLVDKPNSIALRMAMVAADQADLVATLRWGHEWDIGASVLIAREAGAVVTDALGDALHFNKPDPRALGMLCSAPDIHGAALERLRDRALVLRDRK